MAFLALIKNTIIFGDSLTFKYFQTSHLSRIMGEEMLLLEYVGHFDELKRDQEGEA